MSEIKLNPKNKIALVTGANRGIGRAIVVELLNRGIAKVYAGARDTSKIDNLIEEFGNRVIALELDVTSQASIDKAVSKIDTLDILINNAGVFAPGSIFSGETNSSLEENLAVNVWGVLKLSNALLPHFQNENPTVIANVSSLAGLGNMPFGATYSISKAAVHSLTQGMRAELSKSATLVMGIYPGPIDTELISEFEIDKDSPQNVAKNVVDGIESGTEDIFPDAMSTQVGAFYASNPKAVEQQFASMGEV